MPEVAKLTAKLEADTRDFDRGMKQSKKQLGQLEKTTGKANKQLDGTKKSSMGAAKALKGLAAAAAVTVVIDQMGKMVDAASDLEESVNAVEVATGDASAEIMRFGDSAAAELGMSKRAINEAAVSFSAFAEKIDKSDVGGTFKTYATRASDFASVMNLEATEAMRLFQSGLAGETEGLRRFGIDMSAAAVSAFAYAEGIAEAGAKLTETEKVQARYALLLQQTDKFAGDFAATSDGLANSQRILTAELENARAAFGEELLPVMVEVTQAGIGFLKFLNDAKKASQIYDTQAKNLAATLSLGFFDGATDAANALMAFNETQNFAIELLKDGRRPVQVYAEWISALGKKAALTDTTLSAVSDTIGLTNEETIEAIELTLRNADALGLTTESAAVLESKLKDMALQLSLLGLDGRKTEVDEYGGAAYRAAGGVDALGNSAAAAEPKLKSMSDLIGIFSGNLFDLKRATQEIEINKLFAGGGGSGQTDEFASGGIVPGPLGQPRLAVVHGGEEIKTAQDRSVVVNMNGNVTTSGELSDELSLGLLMAGVNEQAEFVGMADLRG